MKAGDRVRVVNPESEWAGISGLFLFVNKHGRIVVRLDDCRLHVDFEPHDLELEEIADG